MREFRSMQQYLTLVRKIDLFRYMKDEEMNKIVAKSEIVHFKDSDKIITQGEISPFLYGIIKGRVNVSAHHDNGEVFLSVLGSGEIFGESAVFLSERRTANVTSLGNTVVLKIHRKTIISFISDDIQAGNRILVFLNYSLLKKLRNATQRILKSKNVNMAMQDDDIDAHIKRFFEET